MKVRPLKLIRAGSVGRARDRHFRAVRPGSRAAITIGDVPRDPRRACGTLAILAVVRLQAAILASRRLDDAGKPTRRRMAAFFFAALFAAVSPRQIHLGARLQSDGFYYFAYLRSIAFDGDVEFTNDYKLLGLGDKAHLFNPTPTGYAQSAWTIGPAIVWAPFFAAAHPVAHRLAAGGADVSTNGVSFPYRQAVCIAGLFYGLLGCWFIYRLTHSSSIAASRRGLSRS